MKVSDNKITQWHYERLYVWKRVCIIFNDRRIIEMVKMRNEGCIWSTKRMLPCIIVTIFSVDRWVRLLGWKNKHQAWKREQHTDKSFNDRRVTWHRSKPQFIQLVLTTITGYEIHQVSPKMQESTANYPDLHGAIVTDLTQNDLEHFQDHPGLHNAVLTQEDHEHLQDWSGSTVPERPMPTSRIHWRYMSADLTMLFDVFASLTPSDSIKCLALSAFSMYSFLRFLQNIFDRDLRLFRTAQKNRSTRQCENSPGICTEFAAGCWSADWLLYRHREDLL